MRRFRLMSIMVVIALLLPVAAFAQSPVVRGVFFYSPTCPHCEQVIANDMPPLAEEYGDQLRILYVDVSTELGQSLYQSAVQAMNIPENRLGVPTVVIGQQILVGSIEIPQQLPVLIEQGLAQGGIAWPAIPGLEPVLDSVGERQSGEAVTRPEAGAEGVMGRIMRDPLANGLSILLLVAMAFSFGLAFSRWRRGIATFTRPDWHGTAIWALVVLGIVIAGYLTFIETNPVEAVCGPIGDCQAVNESQYAMLFGFIPVGLLGLLGYFLIGLAWIVENNASKRDKQYARLALGGLSFFGFLFSFYLTFLEPFVIGATCLWCLSSAVIMTALFLINLGPARAAYNRIERTS